MFPSVWKRTCNSGDVPNEVYELCMTYILLVHFICESQRIDCDTEQLIWEYMGLISVWQPIFAKNIWKKMSDIIGPTCREEWSRGMPRHLIRLDPITGLLTHVSIEIVRGIHPTAFYGYKAYGSEYALEPCNYQVEPNGDLHIQADQLIHPTRYSYSQLTMNSSIKRINLHSCIYNANSRRNTGLVITRSNEVSWSSDEDGERALYIDVKEMMTITDYVFVEIQRNIRTGTWTVPLEHKEEVGTQSSIFIGTGRTDPITGFVYQRGVLYDESDHYHSNFM